MLKLKNRLNPESYLDTNFINMHILENVIWNCFALYKYRFNSTYKIGFLNYLISLYCFMEILESSDKKAKISKILPFYIEALVLNGFLKRKDLESLQLDESKNYVRKFMSHLNGVNSEVPKLKNICRLFIKNRLVNFDRITIDKLSLDDENKNFLLFDHEFQNLFAQNEINLF
ncbi:unnamed protein product [Brachionus calyciflorus]|nr:unnamed protein product [Brachionus calyciflorus]